MSGSIETAGASGGIAVGGNVVELSVFEIISNLVEPEKVRKLSLIEDDELLKEMTTFFIFEWAGGLRVPNKNHKSKLASRFLKDGVHKETIKRVFGLSESTVRRIKIDKRRDDS